MINDYRLGSYLVLKVLRQNETGEVVLAEHKNLKCRRIIKTVYKVHPHYDLLAKEARTLEKLKCESIPIVYDVFENEQGLTLVEENVEGETLKSFLERKKHLSKSEILEISICLTEILILIHNPKHRILHLDIKPENIIITEGKPKLVDFGSAVSKDKAGDTYIFGTLGYAAPEQTGEGEISECTDIFGLGKTMEYMLMYTPIAPKGYRETVDNCLRKGRTLYTNAGELKKALLKLKDKAGKASPEVWIAVTGIPTDFDGTCFSWGLAKTIRRRTGKDVLLIDCNNAGNLSCLEKNEQDLPVSYIFEREGISIAGNVLAEEVKTYKGRGYKYVICDLGKKMYTETRLPFDGVILAGVLAPWTEEDWKKAFYDTDPKDNLYAVVTGKLLTQGRCPNKQCTVFTVTSGKGAEHAARCILKGLHRYRKKLVTIIP